MNIFKAIKEFLFPKMYSGLEIAEMGKNLKFDYTPEVIKLIVDSKDEDKTIYEKLI